MRRERSSSTNRAMNRSATVSTTVNRAIAVHESGRGEAEHLPEREVPGHHGEHDSQRIEADVALGRIGLTGLLGQKAGGLLRVVVAHPGAFLHLRLALDDRLAHLAGHRTGVVSLAPPKRTRRFAHLLRPRPHRDGSPLEERRMSGREDAIELVARGRGERLQNFPGCRIDRLNAHGLVLPEPARASAARTTVRAISTTSSSSSAVAQRAALHGRSWASCWKKFTIAAISGMAAMRSYASRG